MTRFTTEFTTRRCGKKTVLCSMAVMQLINAPTGASLRFLSIDPKKCFTIWKGMPPR